MEVCEPARWESASSSGSDQRSCCVPWTPAVGPRGPGPHYSPLPHSPTASSLTSLLNSIRQRKASMCGDSKRKTAQNILFPWTTRVTLLWGQLIQQQVLWVIAKRTSMAHCYRDVTEISCSCKARDSNRDGFLWQGSPDRSGQASSWLHKQWKHGCTSTVLKQPVSFWFIDLFIFWENSSPHLLKCGKFLDCVIILFLSAHFWWPIVMTIEWQSLKWLPAVTSYMITITIITRRRRK